MKRTEACTTCLGCGQLIAGDAAFCPVCGTRQIPDRPMPPDSPPVEDVENYRMGRSANRSLVLLLLVGLLLLLAAGIVGGWIGASLTDGDDDAYGPAAESMDGYAPIAEQWVEVEPHAHMAAGASADDPDALATSARDARIRIDATRENPAAVAACAGGGSVGAYQ